MNDLRRWRPTVSVVIPMYQAGPWIAETLASVASQTYPIHECVVVDDGSTDDGPAIVRSFASTSTLDIRLVSQENGGVSAARNRGLDLVSGELVALLDADDLWLPTKIQRQVDLLEASGAAICFSGFAQFETATRRVHGVVSYRNAQRALRRWLALEGSGLCLASSGLIRRDALDRVRRFDPRVSICEDLEFTVRICRVGPMAVDPSIQVGYRSHDRQAHRVLEGVATNTAVLFDEVLTFEEFSPAFARRCRAGLDAYVGYGMLASSRWRPGMTHLWAAFRRDPVRLVTIPLIGSARRFLRGARARRFCGPWPPVGREAPGAR